MPQLPLIEFGSATADNDGVATVTLGPQRAFEQWFIESVAVQSTSVTLTPELREYKGSISEGSLIGSSRIGNLDSGVNPNPLILASGERVFYQWTGADVGSTCRVTVNGHRQTP